MSTTANIGQDKGNTRNPTFFLYSNLPRGYKLTQFIDACQWSRKTVYHAIQETGGNQVSKATREEIQIALAEDVQRWQLEQVEQEPA